MPRATSFLNPGILNRFQGLTNDGTLIGSGDPLGTLNAGAQTVEDNRIRSTGSLFGGRPIGGPLPDRRWDAFFGALQNRGNLVNAAGGRFGVDLIGDGPGEGIGSFAAQDQSAPAGSRISHSLAGLQRASRHRGY